jgi:regulator of replication initiation timing
LQRQFQDQDFELHRRRLQVEQDESRVKFERDRIANIENSNQKLTKELNDIKQEMSKTHSENTMLFKENRDMKD